MHELLPCVHMLSELFIDAPTHPQQAVREKYKQPK
jgi:hypothetical protein